MFLFDMNRRGYLYVIYVKNSKDGIIIGKIKLLIVKLNVIGQHKFNLLCYGVVMDIIQKLCIKY